MNLSGTHIFILAIALIAAGIVFAVMGEMDVATALISGIMGIVVGGGVGYKAGIKKGNGGKVSLPLLFLSTFLILGGCALFSLVIPPGNAALATDILGMHDAYVVADENLSEDEKGAYLAESAGLQFYLDGETSLIPEAINSFYLVCDRYDAYVEVDASLDALDRRIAERDSIIFRRYLSAIVE
jgi:hypothetical protein